MKYISCVSLGSFNSDTKQITLPIFVDDLQSASRSNLNINILNGNCHIQQEDLVLSGVGLNTHIYRYYNSQAKSNPWKICSIAHLVPGSNPVVNHPDGTDIIFQQNEQGLFVSYDGYQGEIRLTKQGNTWCMSTVLTGERWHFDETGLLISFESAKGGVIKYEYVKNQLDVITNASGQSVQIKRNEEGKIDRLEVNGLVYVQYSYDEKDRLIAVTYLKPGAEESYQIHYEYDGESHRISKKYEGDGHVWEMGYLAEKVTTFQTGNCVKIFQYQQNKTTVFFGNRDRYEFLHNNNKMTDYYQFNTSRSESIHHQYEYDQVKGYLLGEKGNDGSETSYQYDENGWTIEIKKKIDEKENEFKQFKRNAAGQLLFENHEKTGCANRSAVHYIYAPGNSYQRRFKVTGGHRVSEYIYNEKNQVIHEYRYGILYNGDMTFESLNAWANTSATKINIELVSYEYNDNGDLWKTKRYPVTNENGKPDLSRERLTVQETDIHGRIVNIHNNRDPKQPKKFEYDAIGRRTNFINYFSHLARHIFESYSVTIQYPSGLTINKKYNSAGLVVQEEESGCINGEAFRLLKTTNYEYDNNMLFVVEESDPLTNERRYQYIKYDNFNRPCLEIDQDGYATEYKRDKRGNIVKTTRYSSKLNFSSNEKLSHEVLMKIAPEKDSQHDRVRDVIYNYLNQVRFVINARGFAIEYIYDVFGKVRIQIEYAEIITGLDREKIYSIDEITHLIDAYKLENNVDNRVSVYYNDADGFEVLSIQPNGGAISYSRDGRGNITQTEQFENPVCYQLESIPTAAEVVMASIVLSEKDIVKHTFHNQCNDIVGMIDGEGYVIEYQYDNQGDKNKFIRYNQKADIIGKVIRSFQSLNLNAEDVNNQITTFAYDSEHRKVNETNQFGLSQNTIYGYWDDPDQNYETSTFQYSDENENRVKLRGFAFLRDCRGDIYRQLDSIGLGAIHSMHTDESHVWRDYAIQYKYDGFRRTLKEVNNQGAETTFLCSKRGDIVTIVNAESEQKETVYNAFRELNKEIIVVDQNKKAVKQYERDMEGNIVRLLDPEGFSFCSSFNAFNEKVEESKLIDAQRWLVSKTKYNHTKNIELVTDHSFVNQDGKYGIALEERMLLNRRYDVFGCLIEETNAINEKTVYEYDKRQLETKKTLNDHLMDLKSYDAFQRLTEHVRIYERQGIQEKQTHKNVYSNVRYEKTVSMDGGERKAVHVILGDGFGETIEENLGDLQCNRVYDNFSESGKRKNNVIIEHHYKDKLGRIEKSKNANGTEVHFKYDQIGRQIHQEIINQTPHPEALYVSPHVVSNKWGPLGLLSETTDIRHTEYELTLRGERRKKTENGSGIARVTENTFNITGQVASEKLHTAHKPVERLKTVEYDNFNRPSISIIDPHDLHIETTTFYDHNDQIIESRDAKGRGTFFQYEDDGHVKMTIRPSGFVVIEYFNLDMLLLKKLSFRNSIFADKSIEKKVSNLLVDEVIEMLGGEGSAVLEQYSYSAEKLLLGSILTGSAATKHQFNNAGQEIKTIHGDNETVKAYDTNGHLAYEIDAENYVTRYIHDHSGFLLMRIRYGTRTQARDIVSIEEFDEYIREMVSDHDRFECHQYDMMHREIFTLNAEGLLKQTQYDSEGLVLNTCILDKRFPVPQLLTGKSYNELFSWLNNDISPAVLASWIEANRVPEMDHEETNIRDNLGRITEKIDSLKNITSYMYDLHDHIVEFKNRLGGVTTHVYDAAGRLRSTLHPEREVCTIDSNTGNAILPTHKKRSETKYVYEKTDELVSMIEAYGTDDQRVFSYVYDADGNLTQESLEKVLVYAGDLDHVAQQTARCEKETNLVTTQIYDAFKNVIIRKTADGAVTYQVFGENQKIVFSIDPEGYVIHHQYDLYLNKDKSTRYYYPIDPKAFPVLETGTTPEAIEGFIRRSPQFDRYIDVEFDKLNRQIRITEPPELYFDSNAVDAEEQYFVVGKETLLHYNAFGEVILKKQLVNPYERKYIQDWQFYNNSGDVVAVVNADLYMTVFEDFAFNHEWRKKFEFSHKVAGIPSNISDLPMFPLPNSEKDRSFYRVINGEGLVIEEHVKDIVTYSVDVTNQSLISHQANKITMHEFDSEKNEIVTRLKIVSADNSNIIEERAVHHYYNSATLKVAQLSTRRVIRQDNGVEREAFPVTCFGYDSLNRLVITERSDMHVEPAENILKIIEEKRASSKWHRESCVYGKHGEVIVRFQANQFKIEMSYDALKRISKEWNMEKFYKLENKRAVLSEEQHTTLTRYTFRGFVYSEIKYDRDAVVERYQLYNSFGEVSIEGNKYGGSLEPYCVRNSSENKIVTTDAVTKFYYNRSGMITKTNSPDGVWKLQFYNPAHFMTAKVTSHVHHLGQEKFTPKYLKKLPKNEYQYTEIRHDNRGDAIQRILPQMTQNQNPLFSSVFVGTPVTSELFNVYGSYAAIWKKPTSFAAKARFTIKLKDSERWEELEVMSHGENMGVNLSALRTDLYDYQIQFFHMTNNIAESVIPYASGKSVLAVVNNDQQYSEHLVFKMKTDTRMILAGKTIDNQEGPLTGLEIIPELDPPFYLGVTPRDNGTYEAVFDTVPSGIYKARRADISIPIGGLFLPRSPDELSISLNRNPVSSIYTELKTNVTIHIEEKYEATTDVEIFTEQINHLYRYWMKLELQIEGNIKPQQHQLNFFIEVQFESGRVENYSGEINLHGIGTVEEIIYEEMVPVDKQNEPPPYQQVDIRAKVDCPVIVNNVNIKIHDNQLKSMIQTNRSFDAYNAKPSNTLIESNFRQSHTQMSLLSTAKTQRYIHVNRHLMPFVNNMENIVALRVGNAIVGPKETVDGYQIYDISDINSQNIECQFMGPNELPNQQKHHLEETYVDTRPEDKKTVDIKYDITHSALINIAPFAYTLTYIDDSTKYFRPNVFCKLPESVYSMGDIVKCSMSLIDNNRNSVQLIIDQDQEGSKYKTELSNKITVNFYEGHLSEKNRAFTVVPKFYKESNPPAHIGLFWTKLKSVNVTYTTSKVSIINVTKNITIFDGVPFAIGDSRYWASGNTTQNSEFYYEKNKGDDLNYRFATSPQLATEIASMKVFYDGNYVGYSPITRIPGSTLQYCVNLTGFAIPDQSKVGFQFMSANLLNNYIIENPSFNVRSSYFNRLVIKELAVNVMFTASQSMYLKKKTRYEIGIPVETYLEWSGKNTVSTSINMPTHLLETEQRQNKRVRFDYILKSMSESQVTRNSLNDIGYVYFDSHQFHRTVAVRSPEERDANVHAKLLEYPRGVPYYDMDINLGGEWVNLYSGNPNEPKYYILIKPLPTQTCRIELYLRAEIDTNDQHWQMVKNNDIKYQKNGFAIVNVKSLPLAQYRYKLRAYDENNNVLDLNLFATQSIDMQGYAYGEFSITNENNCNVQVPPPVPDAQGTLTPVVHASFDFQQNVLSEVDSKLQTTEYEYDKQNIRTVTRFPTAHFLKQEVVKKFIVIDEDALLSEQIPPHLVEDISTETRIYPNGFGEEVCKEDANGYRHLFVRNSAGLMLAKYWPDGSVQQHRQNIFGHEVFIVERSGLEIHSNTNEHGIALTVSRGRNKNFVQEHYHLNSHDHIIQHVDADGGQTLSRYNALQQVTHKVDPDGIETIKSYDLSGNVFIDQCADGLFNAYYRDPFGYVVTSIDRGRVSTTHQYNFNMMPTYQYSDDQTHRENANYDAGIPLPRQCITHRYYSHGQLYMSYSTPEAVNKNDYEQSIMLYRYNANRQTTGEHFWVNGKAIKDMIVSYNALNQVIFVADRYYSVAYHLDRNGNIRLADFKGSDPGTPSQTIEQVMLWYTHLSTNEVSASRLVRGTDGQLCFSSKYLSSHCYIVGGRMQTQVYFEEDNNRWVKDKFAYNNFDYVQHIEHYVEENNVRTTELIQSKRGLLTKQTKYKNENGQSVLVESTAYTYKPSGALVNHRYTKKTPIYELRYQERNVMGTLLTSQQEIYAHDNDNEDYVEPLTNDISKSYANFKSPMESMVHLKTTFNDNGNTSTNMTHLYFNEHGHTRKKEDHKYINKTTFYVTLPNGESAYRIEGDPNVSEEKKTIDRTSTFDGRIIAQYSKQKDRLIGKWDVEFSSQPFVDNVISAQSMLVVVDKEEMTLKNIAKMYCFGRPDAAGWLQQHNPQYTVNEVLPIGACVTIPYGQKLQHFNVGSTQPYAYAAMLGNTTPRTAPYYVKMPKAPSLLKSLVPLAIGTIVSIAIQPQMTALFGSKLLGLITASAAAGAVGNLSAQAAANLIHMGEGIDWKQLTTTTMMSVISTGLKGAHQSLMSIEEGCEVAKTLAMMQQTAMINLAQQGYLLSTDQQEQFQWQGLVASTLMSVAHTKVDNIDELNQTIKDVTNIMLKQVMDEQVRSMQEKNAFKGSNIFLGAARDMAMYGVSKATTSSMVRFSQPKPKPIPQPGPQPDPALPPNTTASSSIQRRRKDNPSGSFENEQKILNQSKKQGDSASEQKQLQNHLMQQKYAQYMKETIQPLLADESLSVSQRQQMAKAWMNIFVLGMDRFINITETLSLLPNRNYLTIEIPKSDKARNVSEKYRVNLEMHSSESVIDAYNEILKDSKKANEYSKLNRHVSRMINVISFGYDYGERASNIVYNDTSATSKMFCAGVGAASDFGSNAVIKGLTSGACIVAGVPYLAVPANIAFSSVFSNFSSSIGDKAQESCHDLFKRKQW